MESAAVSSHTKKTTDKTAPLHPPTLTSWLTHARHRLQNKKVGNAHSKLLAYSSFACIQTMQNSKIHFFANSYSTKKTENGTILCLAF